MSVEVHQRGNQLISPITMEDVDQRQENPTSVGRMLLSLRIESISLVVAYCYIIRLLTILTLVQDKICIQKFNMTLDYCEELSSAEVSPTKNAILSEATLFLTKKEVIGLIPNIIMGLYAGSWCDAFPGGRKWCLLLSIAGNFLESVLMAVNSFFFKLDVNWLLFVSLPTNLMGNGFWIAVLSYITVTTKQADRAVRFFLLDIVYYAANAIGYLLGGIILSSGHSVFSSPLHNYTDNFALSAILLFLVSFAVFFGIDNVPPTTTKQSTICLENSSPSRASLSFSSHQEDEGQSLLSSNEEPCLLWRIFTPRHIKETCMSVLIKRPNNFHYTIWWILFFLTIQTLPILGTNNILYPLTERLYNWDYVTFSRVAMVNQLVKPFATLGVMPIIFKIFKVTDCQISIIGVVFNFLSCNVFASIVTPLGFYLYVAVGCIATIGTLGVRSFLTHFLPESEMSRIFSVLMTFEVLQPFVGSAFYSFILRMTIESYPTCAYHVTSGLLVIALIIICTIDCIWEVDKNKEEQPKSHTKFSTDKENNSVNDCNNN